MRAAFFGGLLLRIPLGILALARSHSDPLRRASRSNFPFRCAVVVVVVVVQVSRIGRRTQFAYHSLRRAKGCHAWRVCVATLPVPARATPALAPHNQTLDRATPTVLWPLLPVCGTVALGAKLAADLKCCWPLSGACGAAEALLDVVVAAAPSACLCFSCCKLGES